jgi:integrase
MRRSRRRGCRGTPWQVPSLNFLRNPALVPSPVSPETLPGLSSAATIGVSHHTLRHTFASVAAGLGSSVPTIADLLGRASIGVTQRYIHIDKALVLAANTVPERM